MNSGNIFATLLDEDDRYEDVPRRERGRDEALTKLKDGISLNGWRLQQARFSRQTEISGRYSHGTYAP